MKRQNWCGTLNYGNSLSSRIVDDMLGLWRKINRGLERVSASIAIPKMPNTSLLHVLRPNRSEQRITALRTLIENAFGFRRFRFTNLHGNASLFIFLAHREFSLPLRQQEYNNPKLRFP